ncbi:hypothetical protein RIF29_17172 [Crotalaria pallida]|uniref:Uncharacterized protein n=1 Tax=Crotalaria pallida TaxID=3830 RepID=A0AAN9IKA5_CROPI
MFTGKNVTIKLYLPHNHLNYYIKKICKKILNAFGLLKQNLVEIDPRLSKVRYSNPVLWCLQASDEMRSLLKGKQACTLLTLVSIKLNMLVTAAERLQTLSSAPRLAGN